MGSNNIESIYALSPMQEGMLYHKILNEDSTQYFIRYNIKMTGSLNHSLLRESLDLLAERYEILRTAFVIPKKGDKPLQLILKDRRLELKIIDLTDRDQRNQEECIETIKLNDLTRGFDLMKDSLLRMTLIKRSETEAIALWSLHHIILDGWCCSSVLNYFLNTYKELIEGVQKSELKKKIHHEKSSIASYSEYIKWLDRQDQKTALNYWAQMLNGYTGITEITPVIETDQTNTEMERMTKSTDYQFTEKVLKLAKQCGVTVNTVLESALGILLQRYTQKDDVVFGKVVSGRNADIMGIDQMVGLFINTIPVRISTEPEMTFIKLLEIMHNQAVESSVFEYCSLADIQSQSSTGNDLIKILFVYENYYVDENEITKNEKEISHGLKVKIQEAREQTNYPLNISVSLEQTFDLDIIYNAQIFDKTDVELILNRYYYLLSQLVSSPDMDLSKLELLDQQEKNQILNQFSFSSMAETNNLTVADQFEQQAADFPERVAVAFEGGQITYGELNSKANQLAMRLISMGLKKGDFVAVMAERRIETIAAFCAIIKAGGAYVPIDPAYPEERIRYILKDCTPKVLCHYQKIDQFEVPAINLSEIMNWHGVLENPVKVNSNDDLVLMIYTSGTTGNPKGAMIEHKNIVNLVSNPNYLVLNHETRILQTGSLSFDAASFEIWGVLLNGGQLFLTANDNIMDAKILKEIIKKDQINTMFVTTALFNHLISTNITVFDSLTYLLFGGEKASETHVGKLVNHNPELQLFNMYGPTEATTFATWYPVKAPIPKKLPIGKPINNRTVYVLCQGMLCGIGIAGELCIGGDGLARGYLNREELTAEKFIENPYGEGKLYRTGDLVRWLYDGNLEFLGRIDGQVKIRGFRIELGEIETKIKNHQGIDDAAVIVREDGGEAKIAAYIVSQKIDTGKLMTALKKELPLYMCPSAIMQIDTIPLNRNGKVDKNALPEIEYQLSDGYTEPVCKEEEIILEIFKDILSLNRISTNDNFFEMGGHSLKTIRVINKIEEATGVRLPMNDFFIEPTVVGLAKKVKDGHSVYTSIPKAAKKDTYVMTPAQKRIFVLSDYDNTGVAYNIYNGMEIIGELDIDKVRQAYRQLIFRHEILRTGFFLEDGIGIQKIFDTLDPDIEYEETQQLKEEDKIRYMQAFVRPFELSCPPLFRIKLIKALKGHDLILFDMHHIISDGITVKIIIDDFEKLYQGESLKPMQLFYKDYSEWILSRDIKSQKAYWLEQFADEIPVLNLPLDYKRPKTQSFSGKTLKFDISHPIKNKIEILCRQTGATEYTVMMSFLMILLSKYSRQEEIIIGSPVSGRIHRDTESIAGMFVNTIAIKGFPSGEKPFAEFLREMMKQIIKAQENQEYPFDELVEQVNINRDMSRNPLFDVLFSFQNKDNNIQLELTGARLKDIEMPRNISKFDLSVFVIATEEGYQLEFEYCDKLFAENSILRMADHFINTICDILEHPDKRLGEIDVTDQLEKQKLLEVFNDTNVIHDDDLTVVKLFERMTAENPKKEAVIFENRSLTYNQLNRKANQLAGQLRALGITNNDFVAISAERRIETIIGIIGILKAGGAYVPLDPNYPVDRIEYMVKDCNPKAVLTYGQDTPFKLPVIDLTDTINWEGIDENPKLVNVSNDLIYLIYTSGTSGKPKGVMIEHRGVIRLVNKAGFVDLNEHTVILQTGTLCFDATTFELWGALLNGGRLYLADNEIIMDAKRLRSLIKAASINTMWLTVSLFNQLVIEDVHTFDELAVLLIGGEKVSETHIRLLRESNPTIHLINGYGPTETTTFALTYPITNYPPQDNTPIGKPINNTQIYIANGSTLCGIGMVGELLIAGDGMARGYLNQAELTAKSFIANPFGTGKVYRSGDLARWREDGNIEYLGRVDEQIKLRGFRIELGEIETVISRYDGVQDVVAVLYEENSQKSIHAYFVAKNKIDLTWLQGEIKKDLPDYMIPAAIMQIDKIPVTRNGKTDFKALPKIETVSLYDYVAPKNETERQIIEVFEEVLGYAPVGMKDNFFEIGGDSIKAIRLVSKLKNLSYSITMREIVQLREVDLIVKSLRKTEPQMEYNQAEVSGICKLAPVQKKFFQWQLNKPMHFNQCLMLKTSGHVNEKALRHSLQALAEHHDILRAVFDEKEQRIQRITESVLFELYSFDIKTLDNENISVFIEKTNTQIQSTIDLKNGPLLKAALYHTMDADHLLICIHHLVVDGVSWRIILEDLESGYQQYMTKGEITLPKKTMSYVDWIKERSSFCNTERVQAQRSYWKNLDSHAVVSKIRRDGTGPEEGYEIIQFTMNNEWSDQLLFHSLKAYNSDINTLLLTALGTAIQGCYGNGKVLVHLEGHGRDEFTPLICVDRTVGWFTTIYPVLIETQLSIEDTIRNTMEMFQNIPDYGIGYDLLVEDDCLEVDISFNYLGDIRRGQKENCYFEKSQYPAGVSIAKENVFSNIIFNGLIENGRFKMELWYDKSKYAKESMQLLLTSYQSALEEVVSFCLERAAHKNESAWPDDAFEKKITVIGENIFALKSYNKDLLCGLDLYQELQSYEREMKKITELHVEPFAYQKFFLVNYPENICAAKIHVSGEIQKSRIIEIVREIITEQSVFRMSYDSETETLCQHKMSSDCQIPYVIHDSLNGDGTIYESVIIHSQLFRQLLSKVFIVELPERCYELYFYVHHGLWDLATTEILTEMIREKCLGIQHPEIRDVYTKYTKERSKEEMLDMAQPDLKQFIQTYFAHSRIFDRLLNGMEPKYQIHIKFRFDDDALEAILNDPICWAMQLYCKINMDISPADNIPFLLMHFGRQDIALKTAGLYLDIIPYVYQADKIKKYSNNSNRNYGHLLFQKELFEKGQYEQDFKRIPVVNFYADMETENIFDDFEDIDIQVKDILGGNEITMRIFKDIIYIAVPSIHKDISYTVNILKG